MRGGWSPPRLPRKRPVLIRPPCREQTEREPVPALVEVEIGDEHGGASRGASTTIRPYGSEMNDDP